MAGQALSNMKVLDLTQHIAGPACTKLLADYGADVIKIEPPGVGDGARRTGPFYHDEPDLEKSGLFLYLNTNKRGITLNLRSKLGKEIFQEMVKGVDVMVENFKPGVMGSLGLGYEKLEKINPKLVMTSISNFGQTGPYRDYEISELMALGMGGSMHAKGLVGREPLKYGGTSSIYGAGAVAAMATMAAFYGMRHHGTGEYIDISIMETQAGSVDMRLTGLTTYQYTGRVSPRFGAILGQLGGYGIYPCTDGYVLFSGSRGRFSRIVEMMGNPPELMDPKFYTPGAASDPEVRKVFEAVFRPWCMQHTKAEVFELGQKFGNICAPVNTVAEAMEDPHIEGRGFFVDVEHPVTGKVKYPGRPFIMHESPWAVRRPAPLLGQHNEEVYAALGYAKEDLVKLRETGVI